MDATQTEIADLTREVGAVRVADKLSIRFTPIRQNEIGEKLRASLWQHRTYRNHARVQAALMAVVFFPAWGTVALLLYTLQLPGPLAIPLAVGAVAGVAVWCGRVFHDYPSIASCPINKWEYDIPYGALLAMQEAKQQGLRNFVVWYPSYNTDPIVTGTSRSGRRFLVAHWETGEVYEPIRG